MANYLLIRKSLIQIYFFLSGLFHLHNICYVAKHNVVIVIKCSPLRMKISRRILENDRIFFLRYPFGKIVQTCDANIFFKCEQFFQIIQVYHSHFY